MINMFYDQKYESEVDFILNLMIVIYDNDQQNESEVDCYLNLPWVTLEEEESGRRLLPGARRRAGIVLGQMRTPGDKE